MSAARYLLVYSRDGSMCRVTMSDAERLETEMRRFLRSGKHRDRLIELTASGGETYYVLASDITSWIASTPESRARENELEAGIKAESGPDWQEAT